MSKKHTASLTSFQISSAAETTLDDSLEIYEDAADANSGDDSEKV